MSASEYSILIMAALVGGSLAFVFREYQRQWTGTVLAFAGAFILGIIATHLLPGIFGAEDASRSGIFLLMGFILQLFFSNLTQGVEHGHFHKEHVHPRQFYLVFFGLCLHALVEGVPLSGYESLDLHDHEHLHVHIPQFNHLLAGVALHKLPEAYVLALLMRVNRFPIWKMVLFIIAFALVTPLGALLGYILIPDPAMLRWAMALVVGSLLHIATTILFESEQAGHHRISWQKVAAIAIGMAISLLAA